MMVESCTSNHAIHDGLFNRVHRVFQYVSKSYDSESFIWIVLNNPKVGSTTKIQNQHLSTNNILKHWTPIQPISKEIQVGDNSSQVITCTPNLQPSIACTIHHYQGLTLDHLAFDSNGVHHHGCIYTTLFHVRKKIYFYLHH
jgi:hypothetical protein